MALASSSALTCALCTMYLEGAETLPTGTNPCNFPIWMHIELLPNRTSPSAQRQGLPWASLPAPVRLKFGCSVGR